MTRLRTSLRLVALVCVGALLSGCYSYVPVERPSPGTTVRIRVPLRSGVEGSSASQGTLDLEGRVLAAGDSIVMETTTRRELGTFRVLTALDTVRVARAGLLGLEERVFSRPKTLGLTALVTAGAAGLVLGALDAAGGQKGDGRPGDPGTQGSLTVPGVVLRSFLAAVLR